MSQFYSKLFDCPLGTISGITPIGAKLHEHVQKRIVPNLKSFGLKALHCHAPNNVALIGLKDQEVLVPVWEIYYGVSCEYLYPHYADYIAARDLLVSGNAPPAFHIKQGKDKRFVSASHHQGSLF
jgi:hypothetical protein